MAGRHIGDVFVGINADTALFRTQAFTGVKKSLAGLEGNIPITADTKTVRAQIDALKGRMEALNKTLAEVKIGANGKPAEAVVRRLQLELASLADMTAHVTMGADTTKLDAAIAREELKLAKLNEEASGLHMDADDAALTAKLARLDLQAIAINKRLSKLDVHADLREMNDLFDLLDHIKAETARLNGPDGRVVLDADASRLLYAIAESEASIEALKRQAEDLKIGGAADLAALAAIEGKLLGVEEATKRLNPEVAVLNDKLVQGARGFGRFGLGVLTARVALFGGLSAVSGFHIALDAIIEGLAVIVPALTVAAAGLAAFALAGSDAFRQVYQRLLNIHTVSDAFGVTIGPMTGKLEALHAVVRPQVWQLYGDAIAVAHDKTGLFGKLAVSTGGVIDKFAARLTVLATSAGPGLDKFIASGTRDLQQFGRIFLNLGDAFGKLIQVTEQTHIAEILLTIVNAGAKLLDIFTKLPLPLLATVVAIHGIYLWSGLAATGITALLRPLSRMAAAAAGAEAAGTAVKELAAAGNDSRIARMGGTFRDLGTNLKAIPGRVGTLAKSIGVLFANPWTWVAVGVIALGGLAYALSRTKSSTDRFIDSVNTMVSHATDFNIINTLGAALIQTTQKQAAAQANLAKAQKTSAEQSKIYGGTLAAENAGINQATESVRELATEHNKLTGQLHLVVQRVSDVAKVYGTDGLAGAMALASIAGVKVDQLLSKDKTVWAAALQQIDGVVQGYQNMGQGSTQLANDINVLTISQSDQLKNMQTLNSAFDQFTQIVSGPIDSFLTLANTLKRFGNDSQAAGAQMSGLGTGIVGVSKKVTDASLQLQTDFQDTFKAATQMADAMRLTGTASDKQVAAIKNVVQVLIPMAGSNKAAAAEISSLAQEAGGPATTNLKLLSQWAGKTKDPLGQAQKAAQNAAIGFSNMSLDAQKLGTTLSQDLTKDMATAVENAVGLQGAMNQFAKDLQHGTDVTAAGHKDRAQLYADLAAVGITGKQADSIIKALTDRLAGHRKEIAAGNKARADFNADLAYVVSKSLPAAQDVQKLADAIKNHGDKSDATRQARKRLQDDLVASGVDAKVAKRLVDNMQTSIDNMHGKTVKVGVNFVGSGTGSIAFKESIPGVTLGPQSQGLLGFHAAGGMITGGQQGKDSVLGMLMPGEVVVPTKMVKAGAVDHLRGSLPGFAAGGVVGGSGQAGVNAIIGKGNALASTGAAFMEKTEEAFGKAVEAAFAKAVIKKFQSDMNSLAGNGSAIVSYARSFLGKIPYVFGGTSFSGDDCSGFTQAVYGHFGIQAPRTSEAQYAWATKSSPVPGGLAFYVSPAGGPPPGHVAIVQDANHVISQGGPQGVKGPKIETLRFLPLMGTGVPKGGFPNAGLGGPGNPGIGLTGSGPAAAQAWMHAHLGDYTWGPGQWGSLLALWNGESGWRWNATNPLSGAYGIPQSLPGSKMASVGADWRTNPVTQMRWGAEYIRAIYGNPNNAYSKWLGRSPHWYGMGGLVDAYATGGGVPKTVTDPGGPAAITALRKKLAGYESKEIRDYAGLRNAFLHGPKKYLTKLTMQELKTLAARQSAESLAYKHLAGAGLTVANLNKLGSAARAESRVAADQWLNRKTGGHPGWASGLRYWLGQLSTQAGKGLPGGQQTTGPGGTGLPQITHTYGGDVGDTIGAFLGSIASPFGKAMGGLVFDRGGWLKPGWNATYNATGRPEHLVPAGPGDTVVHIDVSGASTDAEKFLATMIKKYVKVRGGNVQKAYGTH